MRALGVDVRPGARHGTRSSRFGFAQALVVAQIALSLVVVVGAGLFARTLYNLRTIDLGIEIHHLTVFRVIPAGSGDTNDQAAAFAGRLLTRIESTPGVKSAALSRFVPLLSLAGAEIDVPGSVLPSDPGSRGVTVDMVTPHFLETMGTPLLLGRGIEERDRAGAPRVAVINEALARRYFPHESPIGRHLELRHQDYEVVGVARDGRFDGIRSSILPTFFASYWQSTPSDFRQFAVAVRSVGNAASITASIERAVSEVDSNIPIFEMRTEEQLVESQLSQDRLFAALSAIFGALALLLAAIGLYGVRAYSVARRTAEIGIRMALGADGSAITQMILRETGWLVLLGVAIGLGAAYTVTRYIQSMLYGIAARDFPTFAGAAVVLSVVAAVAGCLPARRAARVDPMVALRQD
jgi:predicted permease